MAQTKLGKNQKAVLEALETHGCWDDVGYCGWIWTNHSATLTIILSLARRGLVYRDKDKWRLGATKTLKCPLCGTYHHLLYLNYVNAEYCQACWLGNGRPALSATKYKTGTRAFPNTNKHK